MHYITFLFFIFSFFTAPLSLEGAENEAYDFQMAEPFYVDFPGEPEINEDQESNIVSLFYFDEEKGELFALAFPLDPSKEQIPSKKQEAINILLSQMEDDLKKEGVKVENIRILAVEDRMAVATFEYHDSESGKGLGKIVVTDKTFYSMMTMGSEDSMVNFVDSFQLAD